jgi:ABC-2 type transport system permease protein
MIKQTLSIARKEINTTFSSPMALIFVGVFLAVTLFTFFWVDNFWGRGIADVRPLFRWMPLLMIFLVATLTMRQWSEELQSGTLEVLMTMPIRLIQLVIGKFLAVLAVVILAMMLTLFLPITVSILGNLDFGPVVGGYLAAILMASAYIAIGLFLSSRTDNQLVALILTVLVAGLLHLLGQSTVTDLFGSSRVADTLRALSTSSRFESIERGVIDLRDLLYYASLTGIFLALNVLSLDSRRWSHGAQTAVYRRNSLVSVLLIIANIVALNVWFSPVRQARADVTADQEYSLSNATRELLDNLHEPLLIRGYFSEDSHPLLEPLIPRIRDMLAEYEVVAGDNLTVEIIDPIEDPELEAEANQTYGITPVPLQTNDRSGSRLLNSYFDILIRYGDQSEVLNFQDLITVDQFGNDVEIRLRNLEYDLTSSIKTVVFGFQSVDSALEALEQPAVLTLFYTPDTLPDVLAEAPATIQMVAADIESGANGQFVYQEVNVDAPDSPVDENFLASNYQILPLASSFFSDDRYYLHMLIEAGGKSQVIFPSGDLSESGVRTSIEAAIKRAAPGFLQVVGVVTPNLVPQADPFGQPVQPLQSYQIIQGALRENFEVRQVTLNDGEVPSDVDVLVVLAPQNMTDLERYAIDQFLMRGGSIVVAAGNYQITLDQFTGGLAVLPITEGMQEMLTHYGITVEQSLVMDAQADVFPVQVARQSGGFQVTEIQAIPYPFFVDVRQDGMDRDSPVTANLPAVTLSWASPVTVAEALDETHTVTTLLTSSDQSWTTTDLNIQPNLDIFPELGFPVFGELQPSTLAVSVEGSFQSFFTDRESPFVTNPEVPDGEEPEVTPLEALGMIEQSPESARIVVVGSSEFVNDAVFNIASQFSGERAVNSLQLVQNSVDWFVEDTELATIRSRGASVRVLDPLTESKQQRWEAINYAVALAALFGLAGVWWLSKRAEQPMELMEIEEA